PGACGGCRGCPLLDRSRSLRVPPAKRGAEIACVKMVTSLPPAAHMRERPAIPGRGPVHPMFWKRVRLTLEMIKFEHSIFAMPFALTGALLAIREGGLDARALRWKLVWIVV